MINDGADMPASSGLPRCCSSEDGLDDDDDDDDDEDDHFEAADNLDLGAVDLCVSVSSHFVRSRSRAPFRYRLLLCRHFTYNISLASC